MVQVTLCQYPGLKSGDVSLAFHLVDGKRVRLQYVSGLTVPVSALSAFSLDGSVKGRVRNYDRTLKEEIDRIVPAMHEAYSSLLMSGALLSDEVLKVEVERVIQLQKEVEAEAAIPKVSLVERYRRYVETAFAEGVFGAKQRLRMDILGRKLERYLQVKGCPDLLPSAFTSEMLLDFEKFCYDEYLFVANPKYKEVYQEDRWREWPSKRLLRSTMAPMMGRFLIYFDDLERFGEIPQSPVDGYAEKAQQKKLRLEEMFGDPVTLSEGEFQKILMTPVPERLAMTRNAFILHCCLGCKEIDLFSLSMDNVAVYRGIPYIYYIPEGRKKSQKRGLRNVCKPASQIRVPLVRVAFDIVMRTRLHFPFSADRTYSNQVPQLLKHCGIVQPVEMFDPNKHETVLVPFCDAPLIRLAQRTHLELVNGQLGKKGATGRDFPGMDEIEALSKLPLSEYRILLNKAFKQKNYSVDEDFNIIKGEPFVEEAPAVYVEEKPVDPFAGKGSPYLIDSLSPLAAGEGVLEERVFIRKAEPLGRRRSVRVFGSQFVEFVRELPESQRAAFGQGLLLLKMVPSLPELLVEDHGNGLLSLRTEFHGYEYCTFFYLEREEIVVLYGDYLRKGQKLQLLAMVASKVRKVLAEYLSNKALALSYDEELDAQFGEVGSERRLAAEDAALVEYTSQILRHARVEAGLSQEEFASCVGTRYRNLTPSDIGSWTLNLKNLCRILNALGLRAVIVRPAIEGK